MPKVTIIIPVYNAEKHINRVVQSLLNQTERDIELILIDDGSTDNSGALLKKIVEEDSRCKLIVQKNMGPGSARNAGMAKARGKYLLFLDADDIYEKEMIEELFSTAEQSNADITICGAKIYDVRLGIVNPLSSALRFDIVPYEKKVFTPREISGNLFQLTGGYVWNKLFRASFIRDISAKFLENYCYEDLAMFFTALIKAERIAITHKELITYKINEGRSLSDNRDRYWREFIQTIVGIQDCLKSNKVYEFYEQSYLNKVLDMVSYLFRKYLTEEAFLGLYKHVNDNLLEEFKRYGENFYYEEDSYKVLKCLENTDSALSFALLLSYIKEQGMDIIHAKFWGLPYLEVAKGSNIILWGAGDVGRDLYIQSTRSGWCNVVAWVDSAPEKYQYKGYPVEEKQVIKTRAFDKIVICIKDESMAKSVEKEIVNMGVDSGRIVAFHKVYEKDNLLLGEQEEISAWH